MSLPDPLLEYALEENPPPNPAISALKRVIWIIITLLVIISLLGSTLLPILIRREFRRNPENEIQAHWISNQYSMSSVQSLESIPDPISNLQSLQDPT